MECINTISYSILVNGESKGIITSSKALRQGDSLSPFLFLFCVERLDVILRRSAREGDIKGFFSMQEWSKTYSFFFFSDDCQIFCRSTLEECQKIQTLLVYYEAAYGQMIN